MKRLFFPALFCAVFCGLVLAANALSGPFAARRAARLAAASGCSGSSSAAAGCSGTSAGVTYTYVLPAAPAPAAVAPTPPPKPISQPSTLEVKDCAPACAKVAGCACGSGSGCPCQDASKNLVLKQSEQPKPEAIKPNRPTDGTLVIYGGRMWRWNTAADEWKLVDVETQQAVATPQATYSQPAYFSAASCAGGSCR